MRNRKNEEIKLRDGGAVSLQRYDRMLIDGLAGDLANGQTFVIHDGCTVTRRGDEAIWLTPPGRG